MCELQIQTQSKNNQIQLKLTYPQNPQLTYNFQLSITIFAQDIATRTQTLAYKQVFHTLKRNIVIKDLKYSTMYKIIVGNKFGMNSKAVQKIKNIFTFTQAIRSQQIADNEIDYSSSQIENPPRSNSSYNKYNQSSRRASTASKKSNNINTYSNQQLCNSQLLIKTLAQSNHIVNKSKAHKYMLQGRKCRNIKQFINQKNGKLINREQVGDKMMLYIQSKLLFSQVYKYRDGYRFFNNDWGMGPFYSYDANERDIKKQ